MMKLIGAALATSAGALALTIVSPASAEPEKFNGTWHVQLTTESGMCDSSYSYSVAIQNGAVRLASASGGASINGQVGQDGTVGLTVQQGPASGAASGRLKSQSGSGTWNVSSLCSGRWTARRRSTQTAQAY